MGRQPCGAAQKLRKGLWSPEEDEKLYKHIISHGVGCWSSVPKLAGLQRCGKSCRLRWINYLRPDLKRGGFSQQEEDIIIQLHQMLGNRWSRIAAQLPGRTDNEIKNYWNSCIKKRLRKEGIDPATHERVVVDDAAPATAAAEELEIAGAFGPGDGSSCFVDNADLFPLYSHFDADLAFHRLQEKDAVDDMPFLGYGPSILEISESCSYSNSSGYLHCESGADMINSVLQGEETFGWAYQSKLDAILDKHYDEQAGFDHSAGIVISDGCSDMTSRRDRPSAE